MKECNHIVASGPKIEGREKIDAPTILQRDSNCRCESTPNGFRTRPPNNDHSVTPGHHLSKCPHLEKLAQAAKCWTGDARQVFIAMRNLTTTASDLGLAWGVFDYPKSSNVATVFLAVRIGAWVHYDTSISPTKNLSPGRAWEELRPWRVVNNSSLSELKSRLRIWARPTENQREAKGLLMLPYNISEATGFLDHRDQTPIDAAMTRFSNQFS